MQAATKTARLIAMALPLTVAPATILAAATPPAPTQSTDEPKPAPPPAAPPSREQLEADFRETMTGATLRGHWRMTDAAGLEGKSPLSEDHEESYQIVDVTKVTGDRWIVRARIQFADKDVTIPVPVDVLWAGDTPVITLDRLSMPLLGTYSARVMISGKFYCGTWWGATYGGIMSGQIVRTEDVATEGDVDDGDAAKTPQSQNSAPSGAPD